MKPTYEIKTTDEIIDGKQVKVWRVERNNGGVIINLNKLLGKTVTDCNLIDDYNDYMIVSYIDSSHNKLFALIRKYDGLIGKKDIDEIKSFKNCAAFIVKVSGNRLDDYDKSQFNLSDDDVKLGVINLVLHTTYTIYPEYDKIVYDEKARIFYVSKSGESEERFNYFGQLLKDGEADPAAYVF